MPHTVADSVYVNAGTLHLAGSLSSTASGKSLVVNAGGVLAGAGTINANLLPGIQAGGALSPGGSSSATWTLPGVRLMGDALLHFNLGADGDQLVTTGGVSFGGGAGGSTLTFVFTPGAITTGTPYTLVSGPVSLSSATLAHTGLGYATGQFTLSPNALQFTVTDDGVGLAPFYDWLVAGGLAADRASVSTDNDGDGTPALLEFALGSDPSRSDAPPVSTSLTTEAGQSYLSIRYTRRRDLGRVVLSVEASASGPDFASPVSAVQVSSTDLGDGFDEIIARSPTPLSSAPRQFLRVRATLP